MKKIFSSKVFIVSMPVSWAIFFWISYNLNGHKGYSKTGIDFHAPVVFGFPFTYYEKLYLGGSELIWSGLILNILVTFLFGLFAGFVVYFSSKTFFKSRSLR